MNGNYFIFSLHKCIHKIITLSSGKYESKRNIIVVAKQRTPLFEPGDFLIEVMFTFKQIC